MFFEESFRRSTVDCRIKAKQRKRFFTQEKTQEKLKTLWFGGCNNNLRSNPYINITTFIILIIVIRVIYIIIRIIINNIIIRTIMIIINVFSFINYCLHSPRTGAIPWS